MKLILLKPSMRFEDIVTGTTSPIRGAEEEDYEHRLLDAARRAVGSKATVIEMDGLKPPAAKAGA